MTEQGNVSYSVSLQARTLQPVTSERSRSQWIVGTTSLRDVNEVRVLEYDPDHDALNSKASWVHPEEVWDVSGCPSIADRYITVHSKVGVYGATLWQASPGAAELTPLAKLPHEGIIRRALWHQQVPDLVVSLEERAVRTWQLSGQGAQCVASGSPGELQQLWSGSLHPKNPKLAAFTAGNGIQVWDIQNVARVAEAPAAHKMPARDVDWAPGNEHRLVSCGDDCKLRFWDTRMLARPEALLELGGHSHWVWRAAYNPVHDQLVASSSTDNSVCLWYTPALAKLKDPTAKDALAALTSHRQEGDGRVQALDDHEDSVYGLAWSGADPWLFASMSYDGRVVVNKVPKNTKYKILI